MNDKTIKALLQQYITGTLDEAGHEGFLNSLSKMPPEEAEQILQQLADYIDTLNPAILNRLEERLRSVEKTQVQVIALNPKIWWSVAAAILLFISATWILLNDRATGANATHAQYTTLVNPAGKRNKITLEDGTVVWLNAASTLKYPQHFGKTREVYLSGEAFFEVQHDEKKSFLVHTPQVTTQVLGTTFNIYAFKNEPEVVTVTSGKVHVGDAKGHGLFLIGNQRSIYTSNHFNGINAVNAAGLTNWTKGTLNFNGKTLNEVTIMLQRWYGVTIRLQEQKTGSMVLVGEHTNESLHDVLETLSFALHIKYRQHNNEVILYR